MLWNATAYSISPGEFGCCGTRLHTWCLSLYQSILTLNGICHWCINNREGRESAEWKEPPKFLPKTGSTVWTDTFWTGSDTGGEGTEQILEMQGQCGTVRHCFIHLVHCSCALKPGLREVSVSSLFPSRKKAPQCFHREMVQFSASHRQFNIGLVKEIDYFACFQCQHRDQTDHFPFHRKLLLCVGVLWLSPWSSELNEENSFISSFSRIVFSKLETMLNMLPLTFLMW